MKSSFLTRAALSAVTILAIVLGASGRSLVKAASEPAPKPIPSLPADLAFVLSFSTNFSDWQALNRFHLIRDFTQAVLDMAGPLPLGEFDPDQDLSWLGEQGHMVVLSVDQDQQIDIEQRLLLLVPVKNLEQFQAFQEKFRSPRDAAIVSRQYQGFTVMERRDRDLPECRPEGAPQPSGTSEPPASPTPSPSSPIPPSQQIQSFYRMEMPSFQLAKSIAQAPNEANPPLVNPPELPKTCVSFAMAILPDYVVFTSTAAPIEQFLDAQVTSSSPDLGWQRMQENPLMGRSLFSYYANLTALRDWLKVYSPASSSQPPAIGQPDDPSLVPPDLPVDPKRFSQQSLMSQANPSQDKPPAKVPASPNPVVQPQLAPLPAGQASPQPANPPSTQFPAQLPIPEVSAASIDQVFEPLLQVYDTVEVFVSAQPEGLRLRTSLHYKTPQAEKETHEADDRILRQMPGSTYLVSSGRNLDRRWQDFIKLTELNPSLTVVPSLVTGAFLAASGLDLEKDVLPWMKQDYATFLFPTRQGLFAETDPNFVMNMGFVVQTNDRAAAEAAIRKLEASVVFKFDQEFNIVPKKLNGQPITSWEVGSKQERTSLVSYGWVNQDTLLVTFGEGAMADLLQPYGPLLPDAYTFRTATNSFDRPNQGYFYLNMGSMLALFNTAIPPELEDEDYKLGMLVLSLFRSISATSYATQDKVEADVLIGLAPILKGQESQTGRLTEALKRELRTR